MESEAESIKTLAALRGQNRRERRRIGKQLRVKILGINKPTVNK